MRKLLLTAAMMAGTTGLAENSGPENLKGLEFCFLETEIQLPKNISSQLPATAQQTLSTKVKAKLTAYRIPYDEARSCDKNSPFIYIQIDATTGKAGNTAYSIDFDIFKPTSANAIISLYNHGSYGNTYSTQADLIKDWESSIANLVDDFATDYAIANP